MCVFCIAGAGGDYTGCGEEEEIPEPGDCVHRGLWECVWPEAPPPAAGQWGQ